ncbi:MAG: hypothetical protein K8F91_19530 [Candidatus Obscuribacterales bacterium]|nr:hypothetical protein [Candidatus Obscuribacterales bacterium]
MAKSGKLTIVLGLALAGFNQPFVSGQDSLSAIKQEERRMERKMVGDQADFQLYLQMMKVDNYLYQYCMWNHRWPEPIDQENQVINQLVELIPNNPYKAGQIQESLGASTDPDYRYYNQPRNEDYSGKVASGFSRQDSFEPDNSYEAYGDKKIKLKFDPSLTIQEVEEWEDDPPLDWHEAPGTIIGISNGTNLVVVWGAGTNGRPIRVPGGRKIRLFITNMVMDPSGYGNN